MAGHRLNWMGAMLGLSLALAGAGCGDDDGNQPSPDGGGGMAAAGRGGSGGAGSGGSGGGGTGGTTGGTGGMGMFMLTCDSSVPTTATCGGTQCPAVTGISAMTCNVPCCVDDVCGTANTSAEFPRACSLAPAADPSCPSVSVMGFLELPGCCTDQGVCGVISTISNTCITESMFIDLPENPQPCGAEDAGTEDGG
jgi:hypothetical protein